MDINENKVAEKIIVSLDTLQQTVTVNTPDISEFREMVMLVETKKLQKAKEEAILFIFIAIGILTFEIFAFQQSMIFFAALQSSASIGVIAVLLNWLKSKSKKVKTI